MKMSHEKFTQLISNKVGYETGEFCPECASELVVRKGYSKFLGCSSFPQCRFCIGERDFEDRAAAKPAKENLKYLSMAMFVDDGWEDALEAMYPGGIHCKDDM